jgi:MarR family transcriptional regulator, organic hydroperoxide resistance regulator
VRHRLSSTDGRELLRVEEDVAARLRDAGIELEVDFTSMAAVANVFRVASAARNHLERSVLAPAGLSFTAFTLMWVLWVWGEMEFRDLAVDTGVAKGTLTGVLTTLEGRELVARRRDIRDRRLMLVSCTPAGEQLMIQLFPRFNEGEARLVSGLTSVDARRLAQLLRRVLRTIETSDSDAPPEGFAPVEDFAPGIPSRNPRVRSTPRVAGDRHRREQDNERQ